MCGNKLFEERQADSGKILDYPLLWPCTENWPYIFMKQQNLILFGLRVYGSVNYFETRPVTLEILEVQYHTAL